MSTPLPSGIGRVAPAALAEHGITTLEQIAEMTDREMLHIHGVGPKAVRLLREAIAERDGPAPG